MASKEFQIYEENSECHDSLEVSELLLDILADEQQENMPNEDRHFLEMLENVPELDRKEGDEHWGQGTREHFAHVLEEFPAHKEEIGKCIRALQEMADDVDATHKRCTIASIAANSASASSGILTLLGLILAPVTAGGSLILMATGIGLGAVATAAGLSAIFYEQAKNAKERRKAHELMNECKRRLRKSICPDGSDFTFGSIPSNAAAGENVKHLASNVASLAPKMYRAGREIKINPNTLKHSQGNPTLKAFTKRAAAAESTALRATQGTRGVKKAFAATALAMSKGARMLSIASAAAFLLFDAYSVVHEAKHLVQGAPAEAAAEIREKAKRLGDELQNLDRLYEELMRCQ